MKPGHLAALATINERLIKTRHGDYACFYVWMFWHRSRPSNGAQYEYLHLNKEAAVRDAVKFIKTHAKDDCTPTIGAVEEYFSRQTDWSGGVMPIPVYCDPLTTTVGIDE